MLWVKIGAILAIATTAATLSMHKTGKIADLSEKAGIQAQAIVQKEQAIAQERQRTLEAQRQRETMEAQYKADMEAMARRAEDNEQALKRANDRLSKFREMEESSEEYKAWADNRHPDQLNGLLNSQLPGVDSPGTDRQNGGENKTPASRSNPEMLDE